jgi:GNAT superfamily N-acetyltransferase
MDPTRDGYRLSTDPADRDLEAIHRYLADAYWAIGRPTDVIDRSLDGSMTFTLLHDGRQVGMARVVTDRATFAWLCDVYLEPEHRGDGLGRWMVEQVLDHPELQGLGRWLLATSYSHRLYERLGFTALPEPDKYMIRRPPETSGSEGR